MDNLSKPETQPAQILNDEELSEAELEQVCGGFGSWTGGTAPPDDSAPTA